jgi:hypothetical protein
MSALLNEKVSTRTRVVVSLVACVPFIGLALSASACAPLTGKIQDYPFGVTLHVADELDAPIADARVSLHTQRGSDEGTDERLTDESGGCVFMHVSGGSRVPFLLSVDKEGYASQTLSGVASPYAHLKVTLLRDSN